MLTRSQWRFPGRLLWPAAVALAMLFLLSMAIRAATPEPAGGEAAVDVVKTLPAQICQFLLDTPHRAQVPVWKQLGFTAVFFIGVTILLLLGGGAFGARRVMPAVLFGVFFSGVIMIAVVVYGGIAPFLLVPWGIFMFVKGFKSGRGSPEKWFYPIYESESGPTTAVKNWSWFPPVSAKDLLRPSAITLVLSNLVPVFGVLALGWSVFPIMMLYWMENVVIGFYNVLRMAWCTGKGNVQPASAKLFLIPFFCLHYGLFCLVHGIFVYTLFGGKSIADPNVVSYPFWQTMGRYELGWALLCLVVSHGVSLVDNYFRQGERHRAYFGVLLFQPYVRVVALHLALVLGAGAALVLGLPHSALVLLVLMKIVLDLRAHLAERDKFATGAGASWGEGGRRKTEMRRGCRTRITYR
jgi:hypothetical protein